MSFGHHLRTLRRAHGFTQQQLAEAAGVEHSYISKVENSRKAAGRALIGRLAKVLDTPEDALFVAAGKVPPDIAPILLACPSAVRFLRLTREWGWTEDRWRGFLALTDGPEEG